MVWGRGRGWGRGRLMMMKDSLFLLVSNVFGRECGAGRGPTNDDEGFSVSTDLKCFRKGPTYDDEGFFVSAGLKCLGRKCGDWEGAH